MSSQVKKEAIVFIKKGVIVGNKQIITTNGKAAEFKLTGSYGETPESLGVNVPIEALDKIHEQGKDAIGLTLEQVIDAEPKIDNS